MKTEGFVASKVKNMPKGGYLLKVTVPELGDTFQAFINPDQVVKGTELLQIGDKVQVEFDGIFSSKDQVRLDGLKVLPIQQSKVKAL